MDQPGKVANPARGQVNRKVSISLSLFAPENLVSRNGFGSPVLRHPFIYRTQAESYAYLRDSAAASIYFCQLPYAIGQSRVYRVMQLRTDGVHCRESTGTRPVLKVVPNGCCIGRSAWTNSYASLFPTPTIEVGMSKVPADY